MYRLPRYAVPVLLFGAALLLIGCSGDNQAPSTLAPIDAATQATTQATATPDTAAATITALTVLLITPTETPAADKTTTRAVANVTATARRGAVLATQTAIMMRANQRATVRALTPSATPSITPVPTNTRTSTPTITPTWDVRLPTNTPTRYPTKTPRNTPRPTATPTPTSCVPLADRAFMARARQVRQNWVAGWTTLAKNSQDFNYEPDDAAWKKFKGLVDVTVRNLDIIKLPGNYSSLQTDWDLMSGNIRAIFESQPSEYRTWPPLHDEAEAAWSRIETTAADIDSHACP